jgi:hypothetical protein
MPVTPAGSPGSAEPRAERVTAAYVLAGALLAGAVPRVWLAFHDHGIYWPDEVYQSLEPAHWLVFGYGLLPWEFVDGMRHWAFPGFVAGLLQLSRLAGLDEPRAYLTAIKLVFGAVSLACSGGVYVLARACGARRLDAAAGSTMCALLAPFIYFAPRAMSESAAALPVVLGFALALRPAGGRAATVAGASLLGLAVLFRLQAGVFALALLAILVARREFLRAGQALAVLAVWAVLFGWLDHLAWADAPGARFGGWFHSAVTYLRFNLVEGNAANWGTSPWTYYFTTLWSAAPVAMALVAGLSLMALRRAPGLWIATMVFIGLHVLVPHKELRFIIPAIPLLCALAGIGLSTLPASRVRMAALAVLLAAAAVSGARFHTLTFADVGQYPDRAAESAYDDSGPVNRLFFAARERPSLCGLRVDVTHLAWTGGLSHLHRRVPLFNRDQAPLDSGWISHVIAREADGIAGEVVAREGDLVLVELPVESCVLPPDYRWML